MKPKGIYPLRRTKPFYEGDRVKITTINKCGVITFEYPKSCYGYGYSIHTDDGGRECWYSTCLELI